MPFNGRKALGVTGDGRRMGGRENRCGGPRTYRLPLLWVPLHMHVAGCLTHAAIGLETGEEREPFGPGDSVADCAGVFLGSSYISLASQLCAITTMIASPYFLDEPNHSPPKNRMGCRVMCFTRYVYQDDTTRAALDLSVPSLHSKHRVLFMPIRISDGGQLML